MAELIRRYPIKRQNVVSHIRKATQGAINLLEAYLAERGELLRDKGPIVPVSAAAPPA